MTTRPIHEVANLRAYCGRSCYPGKDQVIVERALTDAAPLPARGRFFNSFAEKLMNQSTKTVANYVSQEQLLADASAVLKDAQNEQKPSNADQHTDSDEEPLWTFDDNNKQV